MEPRLTQEAKELCCEGCGRAHAHPPEPGGTLAKGTLPSGRTLQVCGTRSSARRAGQEPSPAQACLQKALIKNPSCSGCGRWTSSPWALCATCAALLAQGRAASEGASPESARRFFLNDGRMVEFLGGDRAAAEALVAALLAQLGATPCDPVLVPPVEPHDAIFPPRGAGDFRVCRQWFAVHLPAASWARVCELLTRLAAFGAATHAKGHRDGSHVLLRLARGEITAAHFNELTRE